VDRDQTGRVTRAVRAEETGKPAKKNASAAFSGRFSPVLKRIVLCTTDKT